MATKIRLQLHGRKGYAFFPIVIADSRAPRDGRFIERIGSYNPNTNPATISLDFDRALYWIEQGAQPTDTARNILSREGVMLMFHLRGGVKRGAFDEAEAQRRFDAWKADREKTAAGKRAKVEAKANEIAAHGDHTDYWPTLAAAGYELKTAARRMEELYDRLGAHA